MNISQIIEHPQFSLINSITNIADNVEGIFACDLLSHVMGFAQEGNILITVLNNLNVLGVAHLLELSGVVFSHNVKVQQQIIDKANELQIPLISTSLTTAQAVVVLKEMGV